MLLKIIKAAIVFYLFFSSVVFADRTTSSKSSVNTLFYDLGLEGGWIPYQRGANAGSTGVFEEIINSISAESDISFKAVYFPPKRAEMALKSGLVDFDFICLEWFTHGIDKGKYIITEPIFEISEMFVVKTGTDLDLSTPHSYFNLDVGTIAGYFYLNDKKFNRIDFLNEQQVILGLKQDRFKTAILEREVAKHWAKVHDVDIEFPLTHTQGYIRLRLRNEHKHLLLRINEAIAKIRSNGQLQKILNKHNVSARLP